MLKHQCRFGVRGRVVGSAGWVLENCARDLVRDALVQAVSCVGRCARLGSFCRGLE